MGLTKLDIYDYVILPGIIRIAIDGTNDPILVDILSEIAMTNGRIYVEGYYYSYLDNYAVYTQDNHSYMELQVVQTA